MALSNTYTFNNSTVGTLVFDFSLLHLTQDRNSNLGYALAFPFSSTALTISGFETYGDNQFATPITLFPDLRNQQKYQFRYDLSHTMGTHSLKFGVDFIHEPVLAERFRARPKLWPPTSITQPITYRTPACSEPSTRSV